MTLTKRMIFWKSFKGVGSFSIPKIMLQILDLYIGFFRTFSKRKLQHNFPKRFKGHLESVQKFIYFGSLTLPLEIGPSGILYQTCPELFLWVSMRCEIPWAIPFHLFLKGSKSYSKLIFLEIDFVYKLQVASSAVD